MIEAADAVGKSQLRAVGCEKIYAGLVTRELRGELGRESRGRGRRRSGRRVGEVVSTARYPRALPAESTRHPGASHGRNHAQKISASVHGNR